jgi:hypothetical protein
MTVLSMAWFLCEASCFSRKYESVSAPFSGPFFPEEGGMNASASRLNLNNFQ